MEQANGTPASGVLPSEDGLHVFEIAQLSRLSSVLNGLEGGAQKIRRNMEDAIRAVRTGTYRIDPIKLSQRIVGEALRAM